MCILGKESDGLAVSEVQQHMPWNIGLSQGLSERLLSSELSMCGDMNHEAIHYRILTEKSTGFL